MPKSKQVTMTEIARLAGVSESTVSRALAGSSRISEKTKEKIRKIVADNGYKINIGARALRTSKTHTVQVIIVMENSNSQNFSDPFLSQLISHIADALAPHKYDMLVSRIPPWADTPGADKVAAGRADGVIFIGQGESADKIQALALQNYAMVVWGAKMEPQAYPVVGSDNFLGGQIVGRHMIEKGRQKFAFLGDIRHPEVRLRYEGFISTLGENSNVLTLGMPFDAKSAYNAVQQLLENDLTVDGIFAASDVIAMAVIQSLADKGVSVPSDVSVVGYDDIHLAQYTTPALTTVRQDTKAAGRALVQQLMNIFYEKPTDSVTLETELVVRKSS